MSIYAVKCLVNCPSAPVISLTDLALYNFVDCVTDVFSLPNSVSSF